MNVKKILNHSVQFGTRKSRGNFVSFALKIFFYIITSLMLGHYTDIIVYRAKKRKIFGENPVYYIFLQTLIIISTLYLLLSFLTGFMSELQKSIAGSFFIVLYFGMQTNYIFMLKKYMNSWSL